MLKHTLLFVAAAAVVSVAACEEKKPETPAGAAPANRSVADQAAKAAEGLKTQAISAGQTALDSVKKKADELSTKIGALPESTRAAAQTTYDGIKTQLGKAQSKLDELKNASADTWSKLNDEFKSIVDGIGKSITDLTNTLPK